MSTTAIICEYNPFTNGHQKHLEKARIDTKCDTLACIMSGSFTQRGDAAVADKYQRAEIAVRYGADIVIELPLVFAISPADNFAYGAIKTISALPDVEYVSFGSECGDAELLKKTAEFLLEEPEDFKLLLRKYLDEGNSFPKARALAFDSYATENPALGLKNGILDQPNNVLGIAYIMQIKKLGLQYNIHTIARLGGSYNEDELTSDYPSASAIRKAVKEGKLTLLKDKVPPFSYHLLEQCNNQGTSLGDLCLFRLKSIGTYELAEYYDISSGLHNRIKYSADISSTYEAFLDSAKTKKYTMAKLKRISLYALFDITKAFYAEALAAPVYIFVLAINKAKKEELLKAMNESCKNVLLRYSDIDKVDKALRKFIKLDFRAQGTLEIINHSNYYRKTAIIL